VHPREDRRRLAAVAGLDRVAVSRTNPSTLRRVIRVAREVLERTKAFLSKIL